MPNFRSAGAEIFDSEKGIGRKENRAAGAKKRLSVIAGLIFLTSYSALSRISRDPRDKPEDDKEERRPIKREPRGRKMTSLKTFPNKKYTPETVEIFFVLTSFVRAYI